MSHSVRDILENRVPGRSAQDGRSGAGKASQPPSPLLSRASAAADVGAEVRQGELDVAGSGSVDVPAVDEPFLVHLHVRVRDPSA